MEIGKPKRIFRVEPVREPVPPRRRPAEEPPRRVRKKPGAVPAK
jgi:hypothetical protein